MMRPYLWPEDEFELRLRVIACLGCLLAAKVASIGLPFLLKGVVDALDAAESSALQLPLALLLAYGAARLAVAAFGQARDAIFAKVGHRAGRKIALRVYQHLLDLSLSYHLGRRTGELSRQIERGAKAVAFMLQMALFNILPVLIEFSAVIVILLWRYPPSFASITALTIVGYGAYTIVATEKRMDHRREMNARDNEVGALAVDGLINYETVKSFGAEGYERDRLDGALDAYARAATKSQVSLAWLNVGQAAIIAIGVTAIMIEAARGVVDGELTVGDVVLVNAFLLQLYQPLNLLGFVYREVKQALTDLENVAALEAITPEIRDPEEARALSHRGGAVRFEEVEFAYDPRRPVLRGLDLAAEPGERIAIVGPSGAGKSTIARLLFRFYDVTGGRVAIDGQDVREVSQASLRAAIGVVPQDTVLFNDTIAANIAYGLPGASEAEIRAAAKAAQIHDFVESLPDGYRTVVGERGLKLSGGEKQRVAIARVLVKNPPILILDEATSALDSATEAALQDALDSAARGRTTIVIAHRLSTVVDADRIYVLEAGRAVEAGRHEKLLARDGLYATLWRRQNAEGREGDGAAQRGENG